jgi:hypothetical protein
MKSDGAILITVVLSKNGIQNAALIYRGDVARLKNVLVHRNTVNKKAVVQAHLQYLHVTTAGA